MSATTVAPAPDTSSSDIVTIDHRSPVSPLEMDYASRFDGWTIAVRLSKHPVYEVEGSRFGGALVEDALLRTFTIRLYAGATAGDLKVLRWALDRVCAGYYARFPWIDRKDGRRSVPLSTIEAGGPVVACHEPACVDYLGVHVLGADGDPWHQHCALAIEGADWRVLLDRADDEAEWRVELWSRDEYAADDAAAFALALSTAADEARRLNATAGVH